MIPQDLMAKRAVPLLNRLAARWASEPVTYRRGEQLVELRATRGRAPIELVGEDGAAVRATAPDFLVAAADLVLAGVTITPRSGDRIELVEVSGTKVYEVVELGGSPYQPSTACGQRLRIHTKLIDEVTP